MAQTVSIVKSGSGIQVLGYSSNGADSISDMTIFNPNGVKVFLNGNIITMQFEGYPPLTFTQADNGQGVNEIDYINGVSVGYLQEQTPTQVMNILKSVLRVGFGGQVGVIASSASITFVETSATGADFVAFDNVPCDSLDVTNNTGVDIEYLRNSSGSAMPIIDKQSRLIVGILNTNEISFRRIDQIGTPVTISAEAITA
tara:strand:- start:24838 stop:25437 length:600 start_codon:yes stop_codon:yes gene_type:complete